MEKYNENQILKESFISQINPVDIIKLILQFCKENNLLKTMYQLENESNISLNTVDSIEEFKDNIIQGRWDLVLRSIDKLDIEYGLLVNLYEQIIFDLIENDEREVAKLFLGNMSKKNLRIINEYAEKFRDLEKIVNDQKYINISALYTTRNTTREKNLTSLANKLSEYVCEVEKKRLEFLLTKSLEHLKEKHLIINLNNYDLFSGGGLKLSHNDILNEVNINDNKIDESLYVKTLFKQLKFGSKSYIECVKFSPNGFYMATGSSEGLIEIFDPLTGELKPELSYQVENAIIFHKASVTSMNFTKDSKMLCSGDSEGHIKVFKIANGKCLREFNNAASKGITSLVFTKDNSQIISGSLDNSIKIYGLKAGKVISELNGHSSFINDLQLDWNNNILYSASADGSVKIWDMKHHELIHTIHIQSNSNTNTHEISVNNILLFSPNSILISNRTNSVYLMNLQGTLLKSFTTEKNKNIIYSALSNDKNWLYVVDEENILYTFSVEDNIIRNAMKIHDKDVIGLIHHPLIPLLATFDLNGCLNIYTNKKY